MNSKNKKSCNNKLKSVKNSILLIITQLYRRRGEKIYENIEKN